MMTKCAICDFKSEKMDDFVENPPGRLICASCDYFLSMDDSDEEEDYTEDPYPEE
jgi:hypothetical protein